MKTQISTCPKCGIVLLDEMSTCHECGYVPVDQPPIRAQVQAAQNNVMSQDEIDVCPKCGEECRSGLVRCWSCGSFLRPEIEAAYLQKISANTYKVEHVELEVIEATHLKEEDALRRRITSPEAYLSSPGTPTNYSDEGDDFELTGTTLGEDDETFDLSSDMQLSDATGDESNLMDSAYFQLAASPEAAAAGVPELTEPASEAAGIQDTSAGEAPVAKEEPAPEPEEDDLHRIASEEEKDIQRVRKSMRAKGTFLVYCPQGCRIRVKEKHRGMKGKCPRCQSEFTVPKKSLAKVNDAPAEPAPVSPYKTWITDIRLHTVDPTKLRIKPDSLLNECQQVDLGFADENLLIVTLVAGKFGANAKKIPPVRQAMLDHFLKQGKVETLTAAAKASYGRDLLSQIAVAQPTPAGTESLFHDIPVFGTNRIAVRIPKLGDETQPKYLSFSLSEFRAFADAMKTMYGIEGLGADTTIPLSDTYTKHKCKISDMPVQELASANYYEKDPGFKLEVSGYRCTVCGATVSESARAEKKLGGANGKGIAKAKCPGCNKPMGNKPLYQLAQTETAGEDKATAK